MYIAEVGREASVRRGGRVAGNVLALGTVSLITDVSAEMVTAVLPLYLVLAVGLSPLQFGVLDGLYFGVTALVRLGGGWLADRGRRRKLVAGIGYALSALAKPALLLAGGSAAGLGAAVAADRVGKGLRSAPRDALIAASGRPESLGRAFGVHRAMDAVGAFCGPLVAFAVLWAAPGAYDAVFVVSGCVAVFGVLVFAAAVRDRREEAVRPRARASWRSDRRVWAACACAALLGLVTISDAFVYLMLQERLGLAAHWFPLLPLGTAGAFLLLAVPFGRLADRRGRVGVFLGGHLALLAVYALLAGPVSGTALLVAVLALHGVFYAATDGVLMALAGPLLAEESRAGGLAVLQTAQALGRFASSVLVGLLWTVWSREAALWAAAGGLVVAVAVSAALLTRRVTA
ncbi:MFS transporter [Bailinhaonella thermotolerans]|uniref:MFS transporter n=1 Tax=Bailinhaonella thermotolerans TaxID=1070861 RepID=UPI001F5BE10F|nr:MFS transporter [Bailinhaonella thermotolerans]